MRALTPPPPLATFLQNRGQVPMLGLTAPQGLSCPSVRPPAVALPTTVGPPPPHHAAHLGVSQQPARSISPVRSQGAIPAAMVQPRLPTFSPRTVSYHPLGIQPAVALQRPLSVNGRTPSAPRLRLNGRTPSVSRTPRGTVAQFPANVLRVARARSSEHFRSSSQTTLVPRVQVVRRPSRSFSVEARSFSSMDTSSALGVGCLTPQVGAPAEGSYVLPSSTMPDVLGLRTRLVASPTSARSTPRRREVIVPCAASPSPKPQGSQSIALTTPRLSLPEEPSRFAVRVASPLRTPDAAESGVVRRLKASPQGLQRFIRASCAVQPQDTTTTTQDLGATATSFASGGGPRLDSTALSFDEEFTRLRADLAVERAERSALSSRVESLLRAQQGSAVARTTPLYRSNVSSTTDSDGGLDREPMLSNATTLVTPTDELETVDMRLERLGAIDEGNAPPSPPASSAPATERANRFRQAAAWNHGHAAETMDSVWIGAHTSTPQGEDAVLADAQAIFDELEQQLAPHDTSDSVASTVGISQMPHRLASGSSSSRSIPPLLPPANVEDSNLDTGIGGEAPHLLTFYRAKCLDLASQVQKRDTEVVNLRRALNEARCAGFVPESPTFTSLSTNPSSYLADANRGDHCAHIDSIANLTNELRAAAGQLPTN